MAIRYDDKLTNEINRTIKNFNQKITRLEKQGRDLLPDKISKKELNNAYNNRNDLKNKLKELQRFSEKGAEEVLETKGGIKITRYELDNLKRNTAIIKRKLTNEIKRMEIEKVKISGTRQKSTYSQMGDQYYLNTVARRKALNKKITNLNKEEYERYIKLVDKLSGSKDDIFKENYIDMLNKLGYYTFYDNKKLQEIARKLKKLPVDKFLQLFRDDRSIKAIIDYYPIITGSIQGINIDDINEDVFSLYDSLYDNLDYILKDYA